MSRWDAQGQQHATHLTEAAAWHLAPKPVSHCGHSASFDPHGLWWLFKRRSWDDHLAGIRQRFWCIVCWTTERRKIAPIRIDLIRASANDIALTLQPQDVWRRHLKRQR